MSNSIQSDLDLEISEIDQKSETASDNICSVKKINYNETIKNKVYTNSNKRFIKLIDSEESDYLLLHYPIAFTLLTLIAKRARRYSGGPDGLKIGEAHIGDWKSSGFTEQQYRTAKNILVLRNHIKIIETNRTRKKSTTGTTTKGTLVKLLSSNVYDINILEKNDSINDCPTTDQRLTNDEQERTRKNKIVKENNNNKEEEKKIAAAAFFISSQVEQLPLEFKNKITDENQKTLLDYFFKYGEESISNGFRCLKSKIKSNIQNPIGFLIESIKKGWKAQTVNLYSKQQIAILEYSRYLRDNGFKKIADHNEKCIEENQVTFLLYEGCESLNGYELHPWKYQINKAFEELEILLKESRNAIFKFVKLEQKRGTNQAK